jgi:hypothetical protein
VLDTEPSTDHVNKKSALGTQQHWMLLLVSTEIRQGHNPPERHTRGLQTLWVPSSRTGLMHMESALGIHGWMFALEQQFQID